MQPPPKLGRKPLIRLNLIRKQCITTSPGSVKNIQKRRARRLSLVGDIRMPGDGIDSLLQELIGSRVLGPSMNEVDFGMPRRCAAGWMDV